MSAAGVHPFRLVAVTLGAMIAVALLTPIGPAIAKEVTEVLVTNTAADPLPVSIVGPEPIQDDSFISIDGDHDCATLYVVPDGKRLTIEHLSAQVTNLAEGNGTIAEINADGTETFYMPMVLGRKAGFGPTTVGTETVQIFSTETVVGCIYVATAETAFGNFSWSGHLEDLP